MVRLQAVSVVKLPSESQKNWLNVADVAPSVVLILMSMVSKSLPPPTPGWLKVTLA
jgi:hypothetical protein